MYKVKLRSCLHQASRTSRIFCSPCSLYKRNNYLTKRNKAGILPDHMSVASRYSEFKNCKIQILIIIHLFSLIFVCFWYTISKAILTYRKRIKKNKKTFHLKKETLNLPLPLFSQIFQQTGNLHNVDVSIL